MTGPIPQITSARRYTTTDGRQVWDVAVGYLPVPGNAGARSYSYQRAWVQA